MRRELRPPDLGERNVPDEDVSWRAEWENLATAIASGEPIVNSLQDAHYAWFRVQDAYRNPPGYAGLALGLDCRQS